MAPPRRRARRVAHSLSLRARSLHCVARRHRSPGLGPRNACIERSFYATIASDPTPWRSSSADQPPRPRHSRLANRPQEPAPRRRFGRQFGVFHDAPRSHPHGRQEDQGPRRRARADREAVRQGLDHEHGRVAGRRTTSRSSPPARSASTSRSASAACRAAAWSRSTAPSPPARPRWRCRSSPRCRRPAAPRPSSTPSTRSTPSTPASSASTSTTC